MANQMWLLKLLSGSHVGAEIELAEGQYVLGSNEECDLVLADSDVLGEAAQIIIEDGNVTLNNLASNVDLYVDGVKQDNSISVSPFLVVTMGSLHFAMAPEGSTWPQLNIPTIGSTSTSSDIEKSVKQDAEMFKSSIEQELIHDDIPTLDKKYSRSQNQQLNNDKSNARPFSKKKSLIDTIKDYYLKLGKNNKVVAFILFFLIIFMVLFLILWKATSPVVDTQHLAVSYVDETTTVKDEMELENVNIRELPDGSILLTGYIESKGTYSQLLHKLDEQQIPYNNNIVVLDEMLENAKAILVSYGYGDVLDVELDTYPGSIVLTGYLINSDSLREVEMFLQQEVHGLISLVQHVDFQNTRIKTLRSMLRSQGLDKKIKLLDQANEIVLKGRLTDISQGYHIKELVSQFRRKYGNNPKLTLNITIPETDVTTMEPVLNIKSISVGYIPYIILNDGEKYLKGSKLQNGYVIEEITLDYLILKLGQQRIKYHTGDNSGQF